MQLRRPRIRRMSPAPKPRGRAPDTCYALAVARMHAALAAPARSVSIRRLPGRVGRASAVQLCPLPHEEALGSEARQHDACAAECTRGPWHCLTKGAQAWLWAAEAAGRIIAPPCQT